MSSLNFSQRIHSGFGRCQAASRWSLELAELGVVTPYDEGHVRMEHESSREVASDVMGCPEWTVPPGASIGSHWNA